MRGSCYFNYSGSYLNFISHLQRVFLENVLNYSPIKLEFSDLLFSLFQNSYTRWLARVVQFPTLDCIHLLGDRNLLHLGVKDSLPLPTFWILVESLTCFDLHHVWQMCAPIPSQGFKNFESFWLLLRNAFSPAIKGLHVGSGDPIDTAKSKGRRTWTLLEFWMHFSNCYDKRGKKSPKPTETCALVQRYEQIIHRCMLF